MTDALDIGLTALKAHQRALEVTGHNIANATTPGYSRQSVTLSAPEPESITPGMLGRGVDVVAVTRVADDLLNERLRASQSEGGRIDELMNTLKSVEAAFDEPGETGFSTAINNFFATFQDLANNPESTAMRSSVVSQIQTFPARLNDLAKQIAHLSDDLGTALDDKLAKASTIAGEVATLNQRISSEIMVGNHPNDLLDQREGLLKEMSTYVDAKVRVDAHDGRAYVTVGGRLLVGGDSADTMHRTSTGTGTLAVTFSDGTLASATGGSVGAVLDLANSRLPDYLGRLNGLAQTIIAHFNQASATGTNADAHLTDYISEYVVPDAKRATNLDDPSLAMIDGGNGIPKELLPSFTDLNGVSQARDLTINVLDDATGVASKYIVRYQPGSGPTPASRSLDDLVSAINSGRGGGFSVYPPVAGIPGLHAREVSVDGGVRLQLSATAGSSIDFSRALDTRPAASAWTSPTVAVTVATPTLANARLQFTVQGGGSAIAVTYRDATGATLPYPAASPANVFGVGAVGTLSNGVGVGVTIDATAPGTFHDGDTFTVDVDASGNGVGSATPVWSPGAATMTLHGRYTGGLAYDPTKPWSMRVLSSGTIGSASAAPVVEFSYWTMDQGTLAQKTVTHTLDDTATAGTPIAIADGVYASFGVGNLTVGDHVDAIVDGQPDQAHLLPGLGINGMFQGHDAASLAVATALRDDPARLATGWTRSPGDNANVQQIIAARDLRSATGLTIEQAYQAQVSDIGVDIDQNKRLGTTQDLVKQTLENRRADVSGVSIDEEVGHLVLEQQAYAAAARLISTARENIQTLLGLLQ